MCPFDFAAKEFENVVFSLNDNLRIMSENSPRFQRSKSEIGHYRK